MKNFNIKLRIVITSIAYAPNNNDCKGINNNQRTIFPNKEFQN